MSAWWTPNDLDRRAPAVEKLAADLAWDRGGQTMPLCDYDLDRAEEIVTGRQNLRAENVRLKARIAELETALRTLSPNPEGPAS